MSYTVLGNKNLRLNVDYQYNSYLTCAYKFSVFGEYDLILGNTLGFQLDINDFSSKFKYIKRKDDLNIYTIELLISILLNYIFEEFFLIKLFKIIITTILNFKLF